MIHPGVQDLVIQETTIGAGTTSKTGIIQSDALIATLWASTISGTLTVTLYTLTDTGREVELFSFPVVSAPSTTLLLRKSGVSMQQFRVKAVYTGVCSYEIYVRAVNTAGESSVRVIGDDTMSTSAATCTTTPAVLLAATLTDRNSLVLKNWNDDGIVYISEDISKLPDDAWPLSPGEALTIDVRAGVTLYAQASAGTLDVRIIEAGG